MTAAASGWHRAQQCPERGQGQRLENPSRRLRERVGELDCGAEPGEDLGRALDRGAHRRLRLGQAQGRRQRHPLALERAFRRTRSR